MFNAEIMFRRQVYHGKEIAYLSIIKNMLELMYMWPTNEPIDPREHSRIHHLGIGAEDFEALCTDLLKKGA